MAIMILEDTFSIYKRQGQFIVKLYQNSISYCPLEKSHKSSHSIILIDDIIGCSCLKANFKDSKRHSYFTIYAYPLIKKEKKRIKRVVIFEISKSSFDEGLSIAKLWRNEILGLIQRRLLDLSWLGSNDILNSAKIVPHAQLITKAKKLLVFINPKSGPGKAKEYFIKETKPILEQAEIPFQSIITDRANDAYEFVRTMPIDDLKGYAAIITISGDGLLYEIYKGLLHREDCFDALSIPVGTVAGGSGNGLARSLAHFLNEPYLLNPVLVSSLYLTKPVTVPMDLALIQTKKEQSLSFLTIGYGLIADVDIESERLRAIGEARFTVWAVLRVLYLRKYRLRISFKRVILPNSLTKLENTNRPTPLSRSQTVDDGHLRVCDPHFLNEELEEQDHRKSLPLDAQNFDETQSDGEESFVKIGQGSYWELNDTKLSSFSREYVTSLSNPSLNLIKDYKECSLLEQPIPPDWETREGRFISVHTAMAPFIGSNVFFSPESKLTDGVMYLCLINDQVSKINVVKFLLGLEDGTHLSVPGIEFFPVSGLRIEPLSRRGNLTIDGEAFEAGPLHAVMLPSAGRFIVRPSRKLLQS